LRHGPGGRAQVAAISLVVAVLVFVVIAADQVEGGYSRLGELTHGVVVVPEPRGAGRLWAAEAGVAHQHLEADVVARCERLRRERHRDREQVRVLDALAASRRAQELT